MRKSWLLAICVALPALFLVPVAPPTATAAGTDFVTNTGWVWVQRTLGPTASPDQFVAATVSGATTGNRNGGVILRQSAANQYVLVSFSGTRYQVRLVAGTANRVVVDKPFAGAGTGSGIARVEVQGTTITSTWGSTSVSKDNIPALSNFGGTGTGLAIWQDVGSSVKITGALSGALTRTWKSGASGNGVANGSFGQWRGAPVAIAGTWNDDFAAQSAMWSVLPGAEYGAWQADLDISVGGIYKDRGDTWQAAAAGAYDARWRASLIKLNTAWGARPGTMYIRFAHEFNGDWYPWSVQASEVPNFVAAWKRFRAIQLEVMPRHKLVFCPNVATSGIRGLDWRTAFPGAQYVDVMAVDSYNQYPFVNTSADFATTINRVDDQRAPSGLEGHRRFAESVGRPFAVSEWSSNATFGDSPLFVTEMNRWFVSNAGTGPGRLLYEIQFNAIHGDGRFQFFPGNRQPAAASTYAQLF
jgi:Glycosyl hydrolase family 26